MDRELRDGRLVAAAMVWGCHLERVGNEAARSLTSGLNWRDLLLLAIVFDRGGEARPSDLVGPVFTTSPGVTGSMDRLEKAGLVTRGVGADARTRPVALTPAAGELAARIVEPWAECVEGRLERLDDAERAELYRLLVKGPGLWDGVWPEAGGDDWQCRAQSRDTDRAATQQGSWTSDIQVPDEGYPASSLHGSARSGRPTYPGGASSPPAAPILSRASDEKGKRATGLSLVRCRGRERLGPRS